MFGKKRAKQAADEAVMAPLAAAMAGQVTSDGHLRGTYRGRPVNAWSEVINPRPVYLDDGVMPHPVDTLRLQLSAAGAVPGPCGPNHSSPTSGPTRTSSSTRRAGTRCSS